MPKRVQMVKGANKSWRIKHWPEVLNQMTEEECNHFLLRCWREEQQHVTGNLADGPRWRRPYPNGNDGDSGAWRDWSPFPKPNWLVRET